MKAWIRFAVFAGLFYGEFTNAIPATQAEATARPEVVAETHKTLAHLQMLKNIFLILDRVYRACCPKPHLQYFLTRKRVPAIIFF